MLLYDRVTHVKIGPKWKQKEVPRHHRRAATKLQVNPCKSVFNTKSPRDSSHPSIWHCSTWHRSTNSSLLFSQTEYRFADAFLCIVWVYREEYREVHRELHRELHVIAPKWVLNTCVKLQNGIKGKMHSLYSINLIGIYVYELCSITLFKIYNEKWTNKIHNRKMHSFFSNNFAAFLYETL